MRSYGCSLLPRQLRAGGRAESWHCLPKQAHLSPSITEERRNVLLGVIVVQLIRTRRVCQNRVRPRESNPAERLVHGHLHVRYQGRSGEMFEHQVSIPTISESGVRARAGQRLYKSMSLRRAAAGSRTQDSSKLVQSMAMRTHG